MEEIKVGEYVRTPKEGYIGKLIEIIPNVSNYYVIDCNRKVRKDNFPENYLYSRDGCGLKHSFNLIDLIESEDYVNGEEVDKIRNDGEKYIRTLFNNVYRNKDIESIVTKEQFQNCEYKVEE